MNHKDRRVAGKRRTDLPLAASGGGFHARISADASLPPSNISARANRSMATSSPRASRIEALPNLGLLGLETSRPLHGPFLG